MFSLDFPLQVFDYSGLLSSILVTEDGKVQFRNSRDASDIKSYEEFEKLINQNIADQKSMAITQHFSKNSDSGLLKSVTENMLESISENMNKISDQFKTSFYVSRLQT